jgi:PAS domain S-box-containing protein
MAMVAEKKPGSEYESVPFAVLVIGPDGSVSSANPAAHRMLGYPAGGLRGMRLDGLVTEHVEQIFGVFEAGEGVRLHSRALKADGRSVQISMTAEPTNRDGGSVAGVALLCRPLPPWHTPSAQNGVPSA